MAACGRQRRLNQRQRQRNRPLRAGTLTPLHFTIGARGLLEAVKPPLRIDTGERHASILADPSRAGCGATRDWLSIIQCHDA